MGVTNFLGLKYAILQSLKPGPGLKLNDLPLLKRDEVDAHVVETERFLPKIEKIQQKSLKNSIRLPINATACGPHSCCRVFSRRHH